MPDMLELPVPFIANQLAKGSVVPFLGAGANLYDPSYTLNGQSPKLLPSGKDLIDILVKRFGFPEGEERNLMRVSLYAELLAGSSELYGSLNQVFTDTYSVMPIHTMLATLPKTVANKGYPKPKLLIVTTNYDDLLEEAFRAADEPFDLVCYQINPADSGEPNVFYHYPDGKGAGIRINKANKYVEVSPEKSHVIFKIHGSIYRANTDLNSYVITEDDYIHYLARTDISNLVPRKISLRLQESHLLFLGYGLRDWNLRVLLYHIWSRALRRPRSWSIQLHPSNLDTALWKKNGVNVNSLPLKDFLEQLQSEIDKLPTIANGNVP